MKVSFKVLSLALALLMTACGADKTGGAGGSNENGGGAAGATSPTKQSGVYGSWKGPRIRQNNIDFDFQIAIAANSVTVNVVCAYDGESVTSTVTAPAIVTATHIDITEAKQFTKRENGKSCEAGISKGKMGYTVSGNTLTLEMEGNKLSLNR